jgi:hypothetical protein
MKQAIRQQSQQIASIMKSQQQQCTVCDTADFNSERIFNQIHRSFQLSQPQNQLLPRRTISINYTSPAQIERMKHYSAYASTYAA